MTSASYALSRACGDTEFGRSAWMRSAVVELERTKARVALTRSCERVQVRGPRSRVGLAGETRLAYDPLGMNEPPELTGVRHEYLDAGGLRTHVALAGSEDAPPVMLVHGWPQHWWVWRYVIPSLARTHRVIAPDLRGFGWTEAPDGGYEKEQLTADLLCLLDTLGLDRVTWIGHDWGGWTGMLAVLRAPERIDRALILAVPHLWVPPHPRQLALLGYQGPISLPVLGPKLATRMVPGILQRARGDEPLAEDDVQQFAAHIPPRVSVAMYRTFLAREALPIARGRYAREKLQAPTTLMYGERDLVTNGLAPGKVPGQPQLEVEKLDGVGHWIPEQRPQVVIDWLIGRR